MKREFCQLAHKYNPERYGVGGWFLSEKLDGMRALWDGGVSRGVLKSEVPWANCDKDSRYVTPPVATGLWSRLGNVIHAPDYFLDSLPPAPCDGELYTGNRQLLMSIVKALNPSSGWEMVEYHVFDLIPPETWLEGRGYEWWLERSEGIYAPKPSTVFQTVLRLMEIHVLDNTHVRRHPQQQLPYQTNVAEDMITKQLERVTQAGGEGLMVRAPNATYSCSRSHNIQKIKKLDDAEGTVTGYITGRRTDLGSKLLGKMGALILKLDNGKRLLRKGASRKVDMYVLKWMRRQLRGGVATIPELLEIYQSTRKGLDRLLEIKHATSHGGY